MKPTRDGWTSDRTIGRCFMILYLLSSLATGLNAAEYQPIATTQPADADMALPVVYQPVETWPDKLPAAPVTKGMRGLTIDRQERIWTLNNGEQVVQVYSTDGKYLFGWGEGLFKSAHGVRIAPDGSVWIVDAQDHTVRKFDEKGHLLLTLGTLNEIGEDEKHFNKPTDVAITPSGEVFVADGYINNRIVHFDARGRFIKAWGKRGLGVGELNLPHGIALDSKGRLYVVERNNARIQVFDQNGKSLGLWSNLLIPWGIHITPRDEVYVCGSSPMPYTGFEGNGRKMLGVPPKDQLVMKFDTTGRVLELACFPQGAQHDWRPGQLIWVHSIAVDHGGNLYLGDVYAPHAQKFMRVTKKP